MNADESIIPGAAAPEINEYRTELDENEEIENESGELNSQDGEEDDEEAELSPKLAEGFFEIETVRRKRVRKGQVQYLIKWRGWPETANTWEPYANLVSCFDVIEAFEEGLRSGKHRTRKRKRRSSGLVPQAKKKGQGTHGASTSSPLTDGMVKFDEGDFIIPFVCDASHENGGRLETGDSGNGEAIEQGNGNESVAIPSRIEEEKDKNEMDVNLGESTGIKSTSRGSSLLATNDLDSQICSGNLHQKVDGEGLVQANGRLRKRRKAASVKRFSQEQTPLVTNYAAIEQENGNVSVDNPPQVEEGTDNREMGVSPGENAGIQLMNWGSSRVARDNLEPKTSEAICFENGHQKVDREVLIQASDRPRNRRKTGSVKRFSQEQNPQTPLVTNYATIEQGNGCGPSDIRQEVEEGRDHYELDVNPGEYAGTPMTNGGSSRVAVDIMEPQPSEAICFENGHQKVDREGQGQGNGRVRNRRKPASVKRFNQEQTPCVTNYAAPDLTTKNTRTGGIAGQNCDKNSVHRSKSDNSTETFTITEIIKPISFSSSGSVREILVTFMAKRSDGKEVMVDNKYLKANYPLLLIDYYEQHLNYNATAGLDRSGREYMVG